MTSRTLLRASAALAIAASLSGCASTIDRMAGKTDVKPGTGSSITPTERFAINVVETPDRIQLLPGAGALSPGQVQALGDLAGRFLQHGRGSLRIDTPAGGQNAQVASQAAFAAQQVLQGAGVSPAAIQMTAYNATGLPNPTVAVGFSRVVAVVPRCSDYVSDMTKTGSNEPYGSFGCAVTANFAAQVADPGDFLAPKPEGAPDTTRRGVVLKTYREGKPSGTPRSINPAESVTASEF